MMKTQLFWLLVFLLSAGAVVSCSESDDEEAYEYATNVEKTLLEKDIRVSIGVAFSQDGDSLSDIVNNADKEMYKVKIKKYGDRRRNK